MTTYMKGLDPEYQTDLTTAMEEIGAHWIPTTDLFHGAPDLMMLPSRIYPGRQTLVLPGITHPWTPDTCREIDNPGMWVLDGQILVCRGCGLNGT